VEQERHSDVQGSARNPSWTTLALVAGLLLVVLVGVYFATRGNPEQDKLSLNELAQNEQQAKAPAPEKLCASKQTYDLIKRELFRRAAQLRGSDQAAFDQLSGYAIVRMENPVMESQDNSSGAVNCSGSLSLDLPPGVVAAGGHRTLTSDVDYTVQPAADGSGNVVLLRNADPIVTPLATLARAATPSTGTAAPAAPPGSTLQQPAPAQAQENVTAPQSVNREVGPGTLFAGRPSFDCSRARSKGEVAVCSDPGLSELDVNMATQYRHALAIASAQQEDLLRQTGNRFLAYRNRCPDTHCAAEAYLGRMREIRDIMEGRWQPPR